MIGDNFSTESPINRNVQLKKK